MRPCFEHYVADTGKQFVTTQKGYDKTPDAVKQEREVGKPVSKYFSKRVPCSWVDNGWVEEVDEPK